MGIMLKLTLPLAAALFFAACNSKPELAPEPPRATSSPRAATQAYVTACDNLLRRGLREANVTKTVASLNDEMIAACDAALALSPSGRADLAVVGRYQEATRALRSWCKARPSWRTHVTSLVRGGVAGATDAIATGGLALALVVATERQEKQKSLEASRSMEETIKRFNRELAAAGYSSTFWQRASIDL